MTKYWVSVLLTGVFMCTYMMHHSMRCTIELRTLRAQLSSISMSPTFLSDNTDLLAPNTLTDQVYKSVYEIIERELCGIIDDMNSRGIKDNQLAVREISAEISCPDMKSPVRASTLATWNRINYAEEINGAHIEYAEVPDRRLSIFDFLSWFGIETFINPPEYMLNAEMTPGICFSFEKDKAVVGISFVQRIFIEAIGLQHIPWYHSPNNSTSSAPRFVNAYAINDINSELLGSFEFDNNFPLQLFPVRTAKPCQLIHVQFSGNHGNPEYTCVYRIMVYGRPEF